jgi:hypothetical protein
MNVIEAYDHVWREKLLQNFKKDEFRRESLLEQTVFCKTEESVLSWKRNRFYEQRQRRHIAKIINVINIVIVLQCEFVEISWVIVA